MANVTTEAKKAKVKWNEGLVSIPRSRGAITGAIIMLLGIWAAMIPFIGPYFDYAFSNNQAWFYTWERLVFDILPGAGAFIGGLILLTSANRATASFGGWLALASGIWLIVGITISGLWAALPAIGAPLGGHTRVALEYLGYFYGTGAIITALSGMAVGRLSVRSYADIDRARDNRRR